jgi:hypothetical protein
LYKNLIINGGKQDEFIKQAKVVSSQVKPATFRHKQYNIFRKQIAFSFYLQLLYILKGVP